MFTAELHWDDSDLPSTCQGDAVVVIDLQKELYERLKNTTHLLSIFLQFIGVADNVLAGTRFELEDQVSEQIRHYKAACEQGNVFVQCVPQSIERHTMTTRTDYTPPSRRTSQRQPV